MSQTVVEVSENNLVQYRDALRNSREEFLHSDQVDDMSFAEWLTLKYGLELLKNADGYYVMKYMITNEKLFTLFQLKFYSAA